MKTGEQVLPCRRRCERPAPAIGALRKALACSRRTRLDDTHDDLETKGDAMGFNDIAKV